LLKLMRFVLQDAGTYSTQLFVFECLDWIESRCTVCRKRSEEDAYEH